MFTDLCSRWQMMHASLVCRMWIAPPATSDCKQKYCTSWEKFSENARGKNKKLRFCTMLLALLKIYVGECIVHGMAIRSIKLVECVDEYCYFSSTVWLFLAAVIEKLKYAGKANSTFKRVDYIWRGLGLPIKRRLYESLILAISCCMVQKL